MIISQQHIDLINSGAVITAASRDSRQIPSLSYCLACLVEPGPSRVRILLREPEARMLIQDVQQSGLLAVVCCIASTHQTIQIKGAQARIEPVTPQDSAIIATATERFTQDLMKCGFSADYARIHNDYAENELACISCLPFAVFEQTPGPQAGHEIRQP